ncbi:glycoside hydrolase family 43 protein [Massarina eburnea CBS 473.64]|uniref:Arabinan endo-1,5-alpha-L-arabinosidase n=1 Tax=Massarina eburnea CBS 473.64 TaxID=1395130 RepID=A0A6A6RLD9_9PLEO|nr:glycoside hydrolase family 43 protein [Massarina eburnea CBS 473.64]
MPNPSLFAGLISLVAIARRAELWPNPEPCLGNCTYIHDPSVIQRSDGTWFRISTNGNIAIATAPALVGPWEYKGAMLPQGSKIDVVNEQEIWAPDVFFNDGLFYAYYSVSQIGLQTSDIGVATSETAEPGNWTDHGSVGLPTKTDKSNYNRIDPNFFIECPTCDPYFQFGSAWNDIYQTTLKKDFLSWSGSAPVQKAYNSTLPPSQDYASITEGSFMFWWNIDGKKYYYLFFSSGTCCASKDALAAPGDEYKIMVCRSESVNGTFVDMEGKDCLTENGGTLVLGSHGDVYAPGGQGVVVDPDNKGKIALYYHYVNKTIGYEYEDFQFGYNYIDFASGWPIVVAS